MLANVWHWWLGVALTLGSVLVVVALAGGYVKKVTAMKFPPHANEE
jgi:hypothetical protein